MGNIEQNNNAALPRYTLLKCLPAGALAGLVAVGFRLCVSLVFSLVMAWTARATYDVPLAVLWFVALAAAAFAVGRLLKWSPVISGSGIPQLEGEIKGLLSQRPINVLAGKFLGGTLALGAGLSLGREGPCIQMGAVIGKQLAGGDKKERDLLMVAGGGAGLAAAFGAPIAGVIFALEEVNKRFSWRLFFAALITCGVSGAVTLLLLGPKPIFDVDTAGFMALQYYWLLPLTGLAMGAFGALYNLFVGKMQDGYAKLKRIPAEYRVVLPFLATGVLAFILPDILGGGDPLVAKITDGSFTLSVLVLLLVAKLAFSVFSFSSGVPGGILMPMLVMGALAGGALGALLCDSMGLPQELKQYAILCAMAGLFGGVVRAPLTGAVLVCEMSNAYAFILPLAITSYAAFFTAKLLKARPIYEQLLEHNLAVAKERRIQG